ncbi:MAG: MAPEG family protein [Polyangiales bacterium]
MNSPILKPVVALVAWSMVMWGWMYLTRIPAIQRAKMKLDPTLPRGEQMALLPAEVRWKADNYNHLMEQPTLFYALAVCLALMGLGDGRNLALAWAYVAIRVVHSLVQSTWNKIEVRFALFFLSSLALLGMVLSACAAAFLG